jgi:endonuclease G
MRLILLFFLLSQSFLFSQNIETQIKALEEKLTNLHQQQKEVERAIEDLKMQKVLADLKPMLPALSVGEELICHSMLCLVYAEAYEQARWVGHIITPDVVNGVVGRSNDFRVDPKVKTGSAEERDYFLKIMQPDSAFVYDGFGYDRGHLAPSADFRWSERALSESYYYSNMSPQLADFNRGIWSDLEGLLRAYLYRNPSTQLYVFTGPVLRPDLPTISRAKNKVAIPEQFWKIALDLKNRKAIAFVIPQNAKGYPLSSYATSIDEVEKLTGLNFFAQLEDGLEESLEKQQDKATFLSTIAAGDVEPLSAASLPSGHFNTVQARLYMDRNQEIKVCGKVVSARASRKGNILLNLDQKYPNELFTIFINQEKLVNFSYNPLELWKNKYLVVKGKVNNLGGVPVIYVEKENQLSEFGEK